MPKRPKMTSPKGTAVWPWLNEPNTQFDDNGVYAVTLRVDAEEAAGFIEKLKAHFKDEYRTECDKQKKKQLKIAGMPWSDHEDDQGNTTGLVDFKFKTKAKYEYDGKTIDNRVVLVDGHRNPLTATVGGGSTIRVGFEPNVWYVASMGIGMTLRVKMVQVVNLIEYSGSGSTDDYDFDIEGEAVSTDATTESTTDGVNDNFDF
jgi:hypothetical protein